MRWVVFDYGEVISRRTMAIPQLAEWLGANEQDLAKAYRRERDAYVVGSSDLAYWQAVGARLGRQVTEEQARALTEEDIRGWLEVDLSTVQLVRELHEGGIDLALLSNVPGSLARAIERQQWASFFAHRLFSADLGVAKPDPAIWRALVDRLEAEPHACVLLDDRQYNIDSAHAFGLEAIRWEGADLARVRLRSLGLLTEHQR
jgi:putative hydrolase of the HAD superfamily